MGRLRTKSDYEDLRNARILENKTRLASLGVHKSISDLRSVTSTAKPAKTHARKYPKVDYERTPLRRSNRLIQIISAHSEPEQTPLRRSTRLRENSANLVISYAENEESSLSLSSEGEDNRTANAPLVGLSSTKLQQLLPEDSAKSCTSKGICCHFCRKKKLCGEEDCKQCSNLDMDQPCMGKTDCSVCHSSNGMFCRACLEVRSGEDIEEVRGNAQWVCPHCIEDKGLNPNWICNSSICLNRTMRAKSDYEELRNARILENQARLASLGVHKAIADLQSVTPTAKPVKTHVRKHCKVDYKRTPLRRSDRLMQTSAHSDNLMISSAKENEESSLTWSSEWEEKRPANAPLVEVSGKKLLQLLPEDSAKRCASKGRGSVYDPVFGICCHFCRQKKLCGEEDCKRCSNLDTDQPCMGKTDCSVCHSSNGVLCRACLKIRYGEDIEEVRGNSQWMCPHCIEEKGLNPYWICNSSFCLKKRKMAPTGIAIYKAREMGFKSVAHLLMDELQQAEKKRRR
ncbi:uncharacterized protein LOC132286606 [Cornus florida]|uniref:uncharacterized protein LOC132286606 n=1 Tax=Cornus florida TaxID=4283 RepID=UPI00289679FA|nr:uncharacterized protein LOC132286606 [Cornus florida]